MSDTTQHTMPAMPAARVTVGMGDLHTMLRALAPHVWKAADTPLILLQFAGEQLVVFTGGPSGLVAGKVDTRDFDGLTGDPASDHVLIHAATAASIAALFKPKQVEGSPDPMAELELRVAPDAEAVRANAEEWEAARREQRPIHEEALTSPAALHVTDVSGMLPGDEFTARVHPHDAFAEKYPRHMADLSTRTPAHPSAELLGLAGPTLAAYSKTAQILGWRVLLHGVPDSTRLNASVGPDFRGVLAVGVPDDGEAELETKQRGMWMDLLEEVRA